MNVLNIRARRYVTPLREGGSLPAVVDTDAGDYVVKFRGAGQGARALIAELIVGQFASALGLPMPQLAVVDLEDGFGRAEPDPEIRDILRGSIGPNVGLGFIRAAFPYDPVAASSFVAPDTAADIVWLDALTTNIDRTARNPNLLISGTAADAKLWLIDHGAALYFHHDWESMTAEKAQGKFPMIRDHVLLPIASALTGADERLNGQLSNAVIDAALDAVPDALLMAAPDGHAAPFESADANRAAYRTYFETRLAGPRRWVQEAEQARMDLASSAPTPLPYRR